MLNEIENELNLKYLGRNYFADYTQQYRSALVTTTLAYAKGEMKCPLLFHGSAAMSHHYVPTVPLSSNYTLFFIPLVLPLLPFVKERRR